MAESLTPARLREVAANPQLSDIPTLLDHITAQAERIAALEAAIEQERDQLVRALAEYRDTIITLEAKLAEARKALEPFKHANTSIPNFHDMNVVVKLEHLRRAAEVYENTGGGQGG